MASERVENGGVLSAEEKDGRGAKESRVSCLFMLFCVARLLLRKHGHGRRGCHRFMEGGKRRGRYIMGYGGLAVRNTVLTATVSYALYYKAQYYTTGSVCTGS